MTVKASLRTSVSLRGLRSSSSCTSAGEDDENESDEMMDAETESTIENLPSWTARVALARPARASTATSMDHCIAVESERKRMWCAQFDEVERGSTRPLHSLAP